jgi:hypothetical protein
MKLKTLLCVGVIAGAFWVNHAMATQVTMQTFSSGVSGNYRADPSNDFAWVLGNYVNGKTTDNTWFGTFCVETDEFFSPGSTYNVGLSYQAWQGGSNTNAGDMLSVGTAFLYSQFARGTLSGFTYNNSTSAATLQNMIWWLEDESVPDQSANPFAGLLISKFGSLSNSKVGVDSSGSGYGVMVMNLTSNDGRTLNQDQLVYVPDGGLTIALLGMGLLGLSLIRRRMRTV